ncbi:unnamed protein product [Cuscuta epithymum]|uniref:DUF4283 domain-containing protein n=1 Tax=Cuscuta epithymum TaxID=186058 RepID=A0AAV0C537_9ASTE|nr:unnamed protein product [Cuscuta epithymum]
MISLRKSIEGLGFSYSFTIGLIDDKHVLIEFNCDSDFQRFWLRKTWFFSGFEIRVSKWTPDFMPNTDSPITPVWISLDSLPIHLFEKSALFSIASLIGKPVKIDVSTLRLSRPSMARICVELDVSVNLPSKIWIGNGSNGFFQNVTYEEVPLFCNGCKTFGHSLKNCKKGNPSTSSIPNKANSNQKWLPKTLSAAKIGLGHQLNHENQAVLEPPLTSYDAVEEENPEESNTNVKMATTIANSVPVIAVPELTVPTKTTIQATINVVEPTETEVVVPELAVHDLAVQAKTTFQSPINGLEHNETELEDLEPPPVHTPPCTQFLEDMVPTNTVSRDKGLETTRATEIIPPLSNDAINNSKAEGSKEASPYNILAEDTPSQINPLNENQTIQPTKYLVYPESQQQNSPDDNEPDTLSLIDIPVEEEGFTPVVSRKNKKISHQNELTSNQVPIIYTRGYSQHILTRSKAKAGQTEFEFYAYPEEHKYESPHKLVQGLGWYRQAHPEKNMYPPYIQRAIKFHHRYNKELSIKAGLPNNFNYSVNY